MSDIFDPEHCSRWWGIPQKNLKDFHRKAIGVLQRALNTGVWNINANWKKMRLGEPKAPMFGINLNTRGLATYDSDVLTRLVIAAHDNAIRIEIVPKAYDILAINFWPRNVVAGEMRRRHPSIEEAIQKFRKSGTKENVMTVVDSDRISKTCIELKRLEAKSSPEVMEILSQAEQLIRDLQHGAMAKDKPPVVVTPRFEPAIGGTLDEMRTNFRETDLFHRGDAKLVWMNEGDIIINQIKGLADGATIFRSLPKVGEEAERYCKDRGPRWTRVYEALREYRMSNMLDEWHTGYPLVDLLSRDGNGVSIADGEWEMVTIVDDIMDAIDKAVVQTGQNGTTDAEQRGHPHDEAHLEIDEGVATFRHGSLSVTICAQTATINDVESGLPAVKVSLDIDPIQEAIEERAIKAKERLDANKS